MNSPNTAPLHGAIRLCWDNLDPNSSDHDQRVLQLLNLQLELERLDLAIITNPDPAAHRARHADLADRVAQFPYVQAASAATAEATVESEAAA